MHRIRVFIVAAVFLVIALTIPPTIVFLALNDTIFRYLVIGNPSSSQRVTNVTLTITPQQRTNINNSIIIAAILEVIFIALFIVTLYYGINHAHPEHKPGVL